MAIEMASDEVVDLVFRLLVQVLEFMHSRELLDVQSVRQNPIWFALQQVFALVRSDMRDSGENIRGMCSCTLDAVPVIDTTLARFSVDIEVLKVVVEVDRAGAKVAAEKCSVGGEDGSDIYPSFLSQGKRYTGKPLVEVRNDSPLLFMGDKLFQSA